MTLVLLWRDGPNLGVVADTRLSAQSRTSLDIMPKIFTTSLRTSTITEAAPETRLGRPVGYAFAGHTAAGQTTHALASAGLSHLVGPAGSVGPTVREVAEYYSRCAIHVVGQIRRAYPHDSCAFEGVVFGWDEGGSTAYAFETMVSQDGSVTAGVVQLDFERYGLYAIGQGAGVAQRYIDETWASGRRANVYETLEAVIAAEEVSGVGGSVQAAQASEIGVELKPVLRRSPEGRLTGGFIGVELGELGLVGDFCPFGLNPVILDIS